LTLINPKLGDKIRISTTDSKLKEYSSTINPIDTEVAKWKFYNSNENDESYKNGFRIQIAHQKVSNHSIEVKTSILDFKFDLNCSQ
jgi:hypothetical protein